MHLMTWSAAIPLIWWSAFGLYVPGALIALAAGRGHRGWLEPLALGPVVSIALAGADGILFRPLHIRWGWMSYPCSALLALIVVVVVRMAAARYRRRRMDAGTSQGDVSNHARAGIEATAVPASITRSGLQGVPHGGALVHFVMALPALAGLVLAAASVSSRFVRAVPSPEQVTQNYDSVFHYNVLGRILMTGEASPLHALPPVRNVYPIAFQQFAALGALGAGGADAARFAVPAMACTWLVFAALVWPVSVLYLVRTVLGRDVGAGAGTWSVGDEGVHIGKVRPQSYALRHAVVVFLAPILAVSAAGAPFLLLDWGTLYAMFAAQMIAPVLLALLWAWCTGGWRNRDRHVVGGGLAWIMVGVFAVAFCHFRVVFTVLLAAAPLVCVWFHNVLKTLRSRNRLVFRVVCCVTVILLLAFAGVAFRIFARLYLSGTHANRPISQHLNGTPARPTENMPSAIVRWLTGRPIDAGNRRLPVYWPVAVLTVVALALCVAIAVLWLVARDAMQMLRLETDGDHMPAHAPVYLLLASYALVGFVFVSCAGTHADWSKVVTALWYKDQRRLFSAWPMVTVPLICWAIDAILRCVAVWRGGAQASHGSQTFDGAEGGSMGRSMDALSSGLPRSSGSSRMPRVVQVASAALAVAIGIVCVAWNSQMDAMSRSVSQAYAFAANGSDSPMLSSDEYLMLKNIAVYVPQDEQVVSDPWNGSGFLLGAGGRVPYYPHLFMFWDADHRYVAQNLGNIKTDSGVCAVLKRNDLHWYLDMGGPYVQDSEHDMFEGLKVVHGAMRPVARQGRAVLYRITACGGE